MSVHAGAERNVCIIKVSAETPQTTTNPSQTLLPMYKLAHLPLSHPKDSHNLYLMPFAQMRYRCKYQVSSTGPNRLEACLYSLSVSTCEFVTTNPISLRILEFHQSFRCSHTQSMDVVDKDKTNFKTTSWIRHHTL